MKKIVLFLSVLFALLAAGNANALVYDYYEEFQKMSEPLEMLLLGAGLIGIASVSRKMIK